MLTGINVPIRIGGVTVMPGDKGVHFIPPQFVQEILDHADETHIHDEWTKMKFDEGKYKSSDIYGSPKDPKLQKNIRSTERNGWTKFISREIRNDRVVTTRIRGQEIQKFKSQAAGSRWNAIRLPVRRDKRDGPRDCTNTLRCRHHPLCDAGRRAPTIRLRFRSLAQMRGPDSSLPFRPTTEP